MAGSIVYSIFFSLSFVYLFSVHLPDVPRSEKHWVYTIKLDYDEANRASCYLHENAAVTTINNSKWVFALISIRISLSLSLAPCLRFPSANLARFRFGL